MATAAHRPGPKPPLVPAGPAAAVGYVCAEPDAASGALFAAWCERRAAADGWTLTAMVADTDDTVPLAERPGWRRVTDLAATGTIGAVVTVVRPMIGPTIRDWVRASDRLADHGVALVTTSSAARTTQNQDGSR
ncbi:hypothetical protein ACIRYZ_42570 [Kitasatospora sp. NPDC101155]|uniref:hypothetical protein n=1 Tax=Kitasatospora sp. NPDC101155 TaxID=3364097 RepID=UPI00382A6604